MKIEPVLTAVEQPFYDSHIIELGKDSHVYFFTEPVGKDNKTLVDSNIFATCIPLHQNFKVTGFDFRLFNESTEFKKRLFQCMDFNLLVGCKSMFQGAIDMLPLRLHTPIEIPALCSFEVRSRIYNDFGEPLKGKLKFILEGDLYRPAQ